MVSKFDLKFVERAAYEEIISVLYCLGYNPIVTYSDGITDIRSQTIKYEEMKFFSSQTLEYFTYSSEVNDATTKEFFEHELMRRAMEDL